MIGRLLLPSWLLLTSEPPLDPSSPDGLASRVLDALPQVLAITTAGIVAAAAAMRFRGQRREGDPAAMRMEEARQVIPMLRTAAGSGSIEDLESFAFYVGRQIGFSDMSECPSLEKLAMDYLLKVKGCEENIYSFFENDPNPEALCFKLMDELDKCILAYFAFHWNHATHIISQVLDANAEPKKKLKNIVMEATRKMRFDRITRDLKITRVFSTLVEELKAIGLNHGGDGSPKCTEVMVAADRRDRSPVLLLMGGGMGAGKSTVLKDILKEPFWSGTEAVIVEADAFKESDVIYRALSSRGHHNDMLQTAELVHQSSTDAASSLLVTALNEGRDVIMDGTLSWEPFVQQTVAMARDVHRRRYRMGVGYKVAEDGTIIENYWEPADDDEDDNPQRLDDQDQRPRKPYRIEVVGVICDAYLAVVRGIRRAIMVRRAVRVKPQLKSHKNFASAFPRYCQMVEHARLYMTNAMGAPPKLIAWKDHNSSLLVDPEEIDCLKKVSSLNVDANSIYELHVHDDAKEAASGRASTWDSVVLSPDREAQQKELKTAIIAMENAV